MLNYRQFYFPSTNPYYKILKEYSQQANPQVYLDEQTETKKGLWRTQTNFNNIPLKSLCLEIGCNAGHFIIPYAQKNPEKGLIGLDCKYKALTRAIHTINKTLPINGTLNCIFIRANALRLSSIFAENELDEILIFFPDPWEKRAQAKHRWLKSDMVKTLMYILKPEGTITFKTDHDPTFNRTLELFQDPKWLFLEKTADLYKNIPLKEVLKLKPPEVTLFEKFFIRENIPIKKFRVKILKN